MYCPCVSRRVHSEDAGPSRDVSSLVSVGSPINSSKLLAL